MRKILLLIIILFSFAYSQEPTFDKVFLYETLEPVELNNGNIIVPVRTGRPDYEIRFLLLNEWGNKIKEVSFNIFYDHNIFETSINNTPLVKISEDKLLIVVPFIENEKSKIKIIETDSNLNLAFEKIIEFEDNEVPLKVVNTEDGFVILSSPNSHIIKLDKNYSVIWDKRYNLPGFPTHQNLLLNQNNEIVISNDHTILIVSSSGEIVNEESYPYTIFELKQFDNGNYGFLGKNNDVFDFNILDENLISVSSFRVGFEARTFSLENDKVIFTGVSNILTTDLDGSPIDEKEIEGEIKNIIKKGTGGYLLSGLFNYIFGIVISTNPQREFINLTLNVFGGGPYESNFFETGDTLLVKWNINIDEPFDLYFSQDDGNEWQLIKNNISVGIDSMYWKIPGFFTTKGILKIQNANNSEIRNETLLPIQINIYEQDGGTYTKIAANEVSMWVSNNGDICHDPLTAGSGFYWPGGKEADKTAVFGEGVIWGGLVNGQPRVGGSTYRHGLQPGKILQNGLADDPDKIQNEIRILKKKWIEEEKYDLFSYQINNWPTPENAPFIDVVKDGVYNPKDDKIDLDADEMLYYVANDLDTARTKFLYGSEPIGIEIQTNTYAFNEENPLKNTVFKKFTMINKGYNYINDMYLGIWVDPDLGDANDDLVGCDSVLNLAYCYNGRNNDGFYGTPPPAIGYLILQGPVIQSTQNDSAIYNGNWIKGYRSLLMTGFFDIVKATLPYDDALMGDYLGTLQVYNQLRTRTLQGDPIINPITHEIAKYMLPGDPVAGTGWYDGAGWPDFFSEPRDNRMIPSCGPFNMAPKDTQVFIYATFMSLGTDYLNSVTQLKNDAQFIQQEYYSRIYQTLNKEDYIPDGYSISQNYPNPFNPNTKIEYQIPVASHVEIKLYDILGREVTTILNEEKQPGRYRINFRANNLASGVYIYRISATGGAGSYIESKKMLLLK